MLNFLRLSLHVRAVHFSFINNLAEKRLAFVALHRDEWTKNTAVPLQLPKLVEVKNSCEFSVSLKNILRTLMFISTLSQPKMILNYIKLKLNAISYHW